jgi:hypothetical protein
MKIDKIVLYSMDLGERIMPDNNSSILRVPGGWIFQFGEDSRSAVFVPYCADFKPKSDEDNIELPF